VTHAVAEGPAHDVGVVAEATGRVALGPAAGILEGLGEVPVVEGDERLDVVGEQFVDERPVEVEA
jgi:hypothetical protein